MLIFQNKRKWILFILFLVACEAFVVFALPRIHFAYNHRPTPISDNELISLCEAFRKLPVGASKGEFGQKIADRESSLLRSIRPKCHRLSEFSSLLGLEPTLFLSPGNLAAFECDPDSYDEYDGYIFCEINGDILIRVYYDYVGF